MNGAPERRNGGRLENLPAWIRMTISIGSALVLCTATIVRAEMRISAATEKLAALETKTTELDRAREYQGAELKLLKQSLHYVEAAVTRIEWRQMGKSGPPPETPTELPEPGP